MDNPAPLSFLVQALNSFVCLYSGFQSWVRREIIDFDPCDEEAVVMRHLLEQFHLEQLQQARSSIQS